MKVQAQFSIVYSVTREVDVDETDFRQWADDRYGNRINTEQALAVWIDAQDTEFVAEVFNDWRTSEPLPSDFELRYYEVEGVALASPADGSDR